MPLQTITPDDAVLVFRKWLDENTRVLCAGAFFGCSTSFVGRVSKVSLNGVELVGDDPRCTVSLSPDCPDMLFGYAEPKDFPVVVPEYVASSSTLTVGLPFRLSPNEFEQGVLARREKLIFMEFREGFDK